MRSERLFRILGLVDEDLVLEASETPIRKRVPKWKPVMAAAACFALVLGLGWAALTRSHSDGASGGSSGAGNSGHDGGTVFMSYGGPVFPLTVLENADALTAERNITWDFAPGTYDDGTPRQWGAVVTDRYVLANPTDQDMTLTALYPFAGDFYDLEKEMPEITVDGKSADAVIHPGPYSGGFRDAGINPEDTYNLMSLKSWEQYQGLLSSGEYLEWALAPYQTPDIPVTVYEFSDFSAPHEQYQAATQAITLDMDESKTTIFTYGFNGYGLQDGKPQYSYFVPDGIRAEPELKVLIVLGEDLDGYVLQGYQDGGCEDGEEIEGVSCTIARRETSLDEIVYQICQYYLARYYSQLTVPVDYLFRAVMEQLVDYGPLAPDGGTDRYSDGWLGDLVMDALVVDRVLYLEFPITVPAGGSIEVSASLWKVPSFDFYCSGSENVDIQGYDMVSRLGSSLFFTRQTASLINWEALEIVRQNFGFDLDAGITQVELDLDQEHYYIELRAAKDPAP